MAIDPDINTPAKMEEFKKVRYRIRKMEVFIRRVYKGRTQKVVRNLISDLEKLQPG